MTYFIFFLFSFSLCNIWDNLYSHSQSHHKEIPNDFLLELYNENKSMGEFLTSSKLNVIKLTLILSKEGKFPDKFLNFLLDFNNATYTLDTEEKCIYTNNNFIKGFTTKFFLNAYDYDNEISKLLNSIYDKSYYINAKVGKKSNILEKVQIQIENVPIEYDIKVDIRDIKKEDLKLFHDKCDYVTNEELKREIEKNTKSKNLRDNN